MQVRATEFLLYMLCHTVSQYISDNPNVANISSERELWRVRQPAGNHNGGQILFHEGFLLIVLGDGGGAGDIFQNGLNRLDNIRIL